jgi:hypothetical protein
VLACVASFGLLGRTAAQVMFRTPSLDPQTHAQAIDDPYRTGGVAVTWYRGNLHAASVNGVGRDLPRALGDFYRASGYQFLGISDLNTYTWVEAYRATTLTGVPMVDAVYPFGSLLALNMDHWLPAASLQQAVDWISQDGGLPILAAPRSPDRPASQTDALLLHRLFGIEVYDARLGTSDPAAADATAMWDAMLSHGQRLFAFAGDDLQSLHPPDGSSVAGKAWIEVLAPGQDLSALLTAIQQGAFYASTGAAFRSLELRGRTIVVQAAATATIRFVGRGGRALAAASGMTASYSIRGDEGYVRVELLAADGGRAWSQPYFVN